MNPKLKNESGFTLIELLIAAVIITGGMVTMASFMGGLVTKNSFNERKTMATVLAQEKVESLRNDGLATDLTAADNGTETIGTPAGNFGRAWTINDTSNPNVITVTVSWLGTGGNTQVSVVTLINN